MTTTTKTTKATGRRARYPRERRMLVIADGHSGHDHGLTPPGWWAPPDTSSPRKAGAAAFQRMLWNFYVKQVDALRPIDVLAYNGDAIEGKGERSGGVELITADRHEQVRMAREAIEYVDAPVIRLCYGTKYHGGVSEDFESTLRDQLEATGKAGVHLHGHDFFSINGCAVDMKHKVGGSQTPHGRMTPLARARTWNVIWNSERERQPKADIIIRSHVHYHVFAGAGAWLGLTTPALTYKSDFGVRECEGVVDVGMVVFDFTPSGRYTWRVIMAETDEMKVRLESI